MFTLNCWGIAYAPGHSSPMRSERMSAIGKFVSESEFDVVALQEVWTEDDRKQIAQKCRNTLPYTHSFLRYSVETEINFYEWQ